MGSLGRSWTGRLSGGIAGRLHADLVFADSGVTGTIGLHDDVHGVQIFDCRGGFDGSQLELVAAPPSRPRPGEPGEIRLAGVLQDDGEIRGGWSAASGARGAFVLFPDG
jgi:hypothetical protein